MDVQVEPVGPCRVRVRVTVDAGRIKQHVEGMYEQVAQQANLKGFRPGRVPKRILEQRFGKEILADARQSLVGESFNEAVRKNNLQVLGSPELDGTLPELTLEQAFSYQVQVDVKPTFELKSVRGIEAARRPNAVTDQELENALQQLAASKRKLTVVADGEVAAGDFVRVDMVFRHDGNTVLERKNVQISTQIPVAGTDAEEFAAKLTGKRKGDQATVPLTYPETFEKDAVRGKPGEVVLTILELSKVQTPALDDELAKQFEFESMATMRTTLRERFGNEKGRMEEQRQDDEILSTLLAEHPFELPARLVDEETEARLNQVREDLKQKKTSDADIELKVNELKDQARTVAERNVRAFFLMDAIAKKEKVFVTETEVEAEMKQIAANNKVTLEEVRNVYEERNWLGPLRASLMERKVRAFLRENARWKDEPAPA